MLSAESLLRGGFRAEGMIGLSKNTRPLRALAGQNQLLQNPKERLLRLLLEGQGHGLNDGSLLRSLSYSIVCCELKAPSNL